MQIKIESITAYAGSITVRISAASDGGALELYVYPMNCVFDPSRQQPVTFKFMDGRTLIVPRCPDGPDRLYARFAVLQNGSRLPGPSCVTDFEAPSACYPYPCAGTIKGLQVRMIDDAAAIGVRHAAINISQPTVMLPDGSEDALPFESGGRIHYFRRSYIERFDERVRELSDHGIVVNLILLNSMKWDGITAHSDVWRTLAHPGYDSEGFISAFNTVTPEGLSAYIAFIEFLSARYMRADKKYGCACGLIVGNEVDSAWVWGNAGRMPAAQYIREYETALRIASYAARKYYDGARAYVSLDHFWSMRYIDDPEKCYSGLEILSGLRDLCAQHGDFPWAMAHHPYPEDLNNPDFWNDRTALYSMDTGRVTFRNLEVLCAFFNRPEMLYRGAPRPIILSEQGFNSRETPESERLQSAAYCLAYQKVLLLPQIEAFILHAHVDNRDEFGLNLGLWRRDKESGEKNRPLEPKPIYYAFRDIDTPRGEEVCRAAKDTVGEDVWNDILRIRECM